MGSYFFDSQLALRAPLEYVTDKQLSSRTYIRYMNIRMQQMFKYENLPDTIPRNMLEYYLMNNGTCFVTEVNGKLYALYGTFGGEPNPYYQPKSYIIANPALNFSKDCDIEKDGVLMRNDSLWQGLYPLMARYSALMAENVVTIRSAQIMLRVLAMLTAPDDKTRLAGEAYLKKLEKGELAVIGENRFFDGIKMQSPPSNNGSYLTQFIELQQYLKGSFYNEIGLNANFNMKRESIGDGESSLNEDTLLPLCDDMLRCRKEDVEKINQMFGTNITVDYDSVWADNIREMQLQLEQMKNEASQLGGTEESEETTEEPEETTEEPEETTEELEETNEEPEETTEELEETNEEPEETTEEPEETSQLAEKPDINIEIKIDVNSEEEKGDEIDG